MGTNRLEAFSDGVLAIIITIMVLELKIPQVATFAALQSLLPVFLCYALSFVYAGIYWNSHHHMLHLTHKVNGAIMWANLHLLFWLSLTPFVTGWMGVNHFAPIPMALYGVVLLMCGVAYSILQKTIIASEGQNSRLAHAIGRDVKGKLFLVFYLLAIFASFIQQWVAGGLYVLVAIMWLIPDPRIEHVFVSPEEADTAGED